MNQVYMTTTWKSGHSSVRMDLIDNVAECPIKLTCQGPVGIFSFYMGNEEIAQFSEALTAAASEEPMQTSDVFFEETGLDIATDIVTKVQLHRYDDSLALESLDLLIYIPLEEVPKFTRALELLSCI